MKKFDSRLLGGILLIIGTCIGGGMLALPLTNGETGFFYSTGFLVISWLIMLLAAFVILEVNLWFPSGSNIISMARATLGIPGKIIAWCVYLFLLYALLSAYIAGGSDIFQAILHQMSLSIPTAVSCIVFVLVFGSIVYSGVRAVDYANRGLMFGKIGVCALLLLLILPRVQFPYLAEGDWHHASGTFLILVISFGFANIVPSLRTYFHDDIKKLRLAIFIGSLIPLIVYIAWDAAIMGVIPTNGSQGLIALLHSDHSTSDLTASLISITKNRWVAEFFRFFTSICMLTAFLGVSLGLFDFLSDGLKIAKRGATGLVIAGLAYLPPLILVLFYPGIFITALNYAGLFAVILLILLPALMLGVGRYIKNIPQKASRLRVAANEDSNKYWDYESKQLPKHTVLHPQENPTPPSSFSIKRGKTTVALLIVVSLFLIYLAIPT